MAEPQFLFAEIPLSRSAFDRWLKSTLIPASFWPEWINIECSAEKNGQTVLQGLLPFFLADPTMQNFMLVHNKVHGVIRCALWLRYEDMGDIMIELVVLLRSIGSYMATRTQAQVHIGENIQGTLTLSKDETHWVSECRQFSFPSWASDWLSSLGNQLEIPDSQWIDAKINNQLKRRYNHYLLSATPENLVAIKKTKYLYNGREVVDYQGNCIPGANPHTFKRICHTYWDDIYTDGKGVWIDSEIAGLHRHQIASGLREDQIQVWHDDCDAPFLLRTGDRLWFIVQDKCPGPFHLRYVTIDAPTFHQLTWCDFVDINAHYLLSAGNGGLTILETSRPEDILGTVDDFLLTNNGVLFRGKILPDADEKSFRSMGVNKSFNVMTDEYYYRDNCHIWVGTKLLEGINLENFRFIDTQQGLATDGKQVIANGHCVPDVDPETVEVLSRGQLFFWKDKKSVWFNDSKLSNASALHNVVMVYPGSVYCRVGDRIWCKTNEIEGADADSFVVSEWNEARDNNGCYYFGRLISIN